MSCSSQSHHQTATLCHTCCGNASLGLHLYSKGYNSSASSSGVSAAVCLHCSITCKAQAGNTHVPIGQLHSSTDAPPTKAPTHTSNKLRAYAVDEAGTQVRHVHIQSSHQLQAVLLKSTLGTLLAATSGAACSASAAGLRQPHSIPA